MTCITRHHPRTFALLLLLFLLITAFTVVTAAGASANLTGIPLEMPETQLNITATTDYFA